MRIRSELRWRKRRIAWLHGITLITTFFIRGTGAVTKQDDAIVIEASSNDVSSDPSNSRNARQMFPGFGQGVFPPGWPFGMNKPVSISQQPQFPQFPHFPGIQHLQSIQPTQPPTTTAPSHVSGPCITNNGLTGYCASFRQCFPILYSPDDGHIMNNGLAEMYMNVSGPCRGSEPPNLFMFRADAQLRQNQICCGSNLVPQQTFPGFPAFSGNIYYPQVTMRPPWAIHGHPTTTAATTTTTTTTTSRPIWTWSTQATTRKPHTWATQPTHPPPQNPWATQPTHPPPQNPWATQPTHAPPPHSPSTTTLPPVPSSCGVAKIVGGSQAQKGEFPWLVALVRNGRQVCGGTLIDTQYILTAAHCFNGVSGHELTTLFKVYIGDYDLHTLNDGPMTVKSVSKLLLHREFNQQTFYNDIALLKLDSPVQIGSNGNNDIRPICLSNGGNYEGQPAVVAGWGRTSSQSTYQPGIYRKVDLKVWNLQQCANTYGSLAPGGITSHMLCAGVTNKDSCLGDSGGPLMRRNGNVWEQIGIVSWGIGCGTYPGVYTKVSDYQDWIARHRHS